MDRAAKVKKYRKMTRSRNKHMQQHSNAYGICIFGLSIVAIGILTVLFVTLHRQDKETGLTYVTEGEFASLMSFIMDDTLDSQARTSHSAITQGKLKEWIQKIGLSEMVSITGGNKKLSRDIVMEYYDQILDYLDLDGSVRKKTILCMEQSDGSCQTEKGKLKLNVDSLKLKSFQAYDIYRMDQTLLGVYAPSDHTFTLKDVMVDSVAEGQLFFEYQGKGYQILCANSDGLFENAHCTLNIKDGEVVKIKDIEGGSDSQDLAAAMAKDTVTQSKPKSVRVLLLNQGAIHYNQVYLTCDGACEVEKNEKKIKYKKSDVISAKKIKIKKGRYITAAPLKDNSQLFLADANGTVTSNGYYGSIEIHRDAEGYYIVNQVNIEKYLYSVVASEMPSYFEPEALKAQAVCARSYVYRQMAAEDYSKYHAQIDDSTNYQVYNRSAVSEADISAVTETAGEIMYAQDEIVNAYYFSASCGYTSGMEIWNQKDTCTYLKAKSLTASGKAFDLSKEDAFRKYITTKDKDVFDSSSPYFRWNAKVELSGCLEELKEAIQSRYKINPANVTFYSTTGKKAKKVSSLKGFGGVKKMYSAKRNKSGAILKLVICFEFGTVEIKSEYNIRSILGCALEKITYADGSVNTTAKFLPSAYFSISFHKKSGRYLLAGGGHGHGMGMSQYAADGMAKEGWDYKKILGFFYDGIIVKKNCVNNRLLK